MQVDEWLSTELGRNIWNNKYRYKNESLEDWFERVSGSDSFVKNIIKDQRFLFGGRTLANRKTGKNASYSNCYSSGYVPDSLSGIMDTAKNLALTYKAQGGQGVSLSKIRPKGTDIGGEFESDGIVPFMEIFNSTTKGVSQGGSRKGALLMSLACDHQEIERFINIKSQEGMIEKANLSVEINDQFMEAVKEYFNSGKEIKLNIKKEYKNNTIEYEITPIHIYRQIIENAYDWAEPGVIYINRFRNYNMMEYRDDYEVVTGNP